MDEEEIEKVVLAYLKKKGLKQTELAFQEEQQQAKNNADPDVAKQVVSFSDLVQQEIILLVRRIIRTARIWSMDRIQPLRIKCVQWHANCNYIATGSSDKTVRLWDVQSGECVRIFIGHRSMILSLAMSPNGRYMASGDEDGTIMMWDLSSGRCVTPLVSHTSCVWTLDYSCEGSLLASGSADCTVKLWDVTSSTRVPKAEENFLGEIFSLLLDLSLQMG